MSDNLSETFSETLREQLDEREYGNQFTYVSDMFSSAGSCHTGKKFSTVYFFYIENF
jgi:hypothetical protein